VIQSITRLVAEVPESVIMEAVEIRVPGLLLRAWHPADVPAVLDALREPDIAQWNPAPADLDLAAAHRWVSRRADWSGGDHASLAVADPETGELLGSVSLHRIYDGDASIGYWTVAGARGQGVASRAVAAMSEWGFTTLGLHRIELCHAVANPGSCRVAQRAGYLLEGTLRESHRYGDGRRYDEHIHARLATDG
jgi:RimJ/RimL family protein N-acetyltransferase